MWYFLVRSVFVVTDTHKQMSTRPPKQKTQSQERTEGNSVSRICEHLRRDILHGDLLPGTALVESDLTEAFGVSRGPVREALRSLEAEGLIERENHRAATVRLVTRDEMVEIFDVRGALEAHAAAGAAVNARKKRDAQAWLRAAIKLWGSDVLIKDVSRHTEENERFHRTIAQLSDNKTLERMINQLEIPGFRKLLIPKLGDVALERSCADHLKIAKAILAGRAEAAGHAMQEHVHSTLERALRAFPDTVFSHQKRMSPVQLILSRSTATYGTTDG